MLRHPRVTWYRCDRASHLPLCLQQQVPPYRGPPVVFVHVFFSSQNGPSITAERRVSACKYSNANILTLRPRACHDQLAQSSDLPDSCLASHTQGRCSGCFSRPEGSQVVTPGPLCCSTGTSNTNCRIQRVVKVTR